MQYLSSANHKYAYLWNKYRPVIIKLMKDSTNEPQTYKLSSHEFIQANPVKKAGFAFDLQLFKSAAINNIKTSDIAKDLLLILQQSKTAVELSENFMYELSMDKNFVLHVKQQEAPDIE